jgi:protein-S-isoprenylcysteine O-methyltransferase Ste14
MTSRLLDIRLVRHPAYTTMLMWWMGAKPEYAAFAQVIALTEIWKREQQESV